MESDGACGAAFSRAERESPREYARHNKALSDLGGEQGSVGSRPGTGRRKVINCLVVDWLWPYTRQLEQSKYETI